MFKNNKKIWIIVLVVVAIAAILYFVLRKPAEKISSKMPATTVTMNADFAAITNPYPEVQKFLLQYLKTDALQRKYAELFKENGEDATLIAYFSDPGQIKTYGSEIGAQFSHTFWSITQLGVIPSVPANSAAFEAAAAKFRQILVLI